MGSSFLTLLVSFFACSGSGPIAVPMLPIISRVASFMSKLGATCLRNAVRECAPAAAAGCRIFRLFCRNPTREWELGNFREPRDNMDGAIKTVAVPPNYQ